MIFMFVECKQKHAAMTPGISVRNIELAFEHRAIASGSGGILPGARFLLDSGRSWTLVQPTLSACVRTFAVNW